MTKLRDYLRIADAADYLGVSPNTLRNWERADGHGRLSLLVPTNQTTAFSRPAWPGLRQR